MKRTFCLIAAVILILCFAACSQEPNSSADNNLAVDIQAAKDKIIDELKISGAMDIPTQRLLDLYGIDGSDISESACFATMTGAFPDEVVMIVASDDSAADRVAQKLETRLEQVLVQSKNYSPEDYEIAQQCKVLRKGKTVALFVSPLRAEMEEIFNSSETIAP